MADLELTVNKIANRIASEAGYDNLSGDRAVRVMEWVNNAYARFMAGYHPFDKYVHQWSFAVKSYDLSVSADDDDYDLPSDFGGLTSMPVYQHESGENFPDLREITPTKWRELKEATDADSTGDADRYAIIPGAFSASGSQPWQIVFYPMFDASHTITVPYRLRPDKLTDEAIYHMGGPDFTRCILYGAYAELEHAKNQEDGDWTTRFRVAMARCIETDEAYYTEPSDDCAADTDLGISV